MYNFFQNNKKELCCGCRGCEQICPTNCIQMKEDEEGFLYPIIDKDKCIKCTMCEEVCPIKDGGYTNKDTFKSPYVYAAYHRDKQILADSTSGGAFTAITQAFCDKNYIIFGARFDETFVVKHSFVGDKKDINKFRGSKYVQSNIGNSFKEVKTFLNEGKKVLFTGTPCQVAGLKNFLQNDYDNLLCLDFVCHGVPSPKLFKMYKFYMEQKYNSNIKAINFRDKGKKNWLLSYVTLLLDNGKKYSEVHSDDIFIIGFYNNYYTRPVCHTCHFTKPKRVSDITIADFWGVEEIKPDFANKKGTSLILVNSAKGQEVFNNIDQYLIYETASLEDAMKFNPQLYRPTETNTMREDFMLDLSNGMNFNELRKKYLKKRFFLKRIISKTISRKTKNKIKSFLRIK